MLNRSLNAVLVRLAIVAAALALLMLVAPVASAQSASECAVDDKTLKCTYDENGEDPVAQFSVSDEDTDTADITWSLAETDDYKDFAINSDGVLTFKKKPDFETKSSYKVTVTTSAGGSHAVEVTIKNLEEDGEVTFDGNPQPQVGGSLRAVLKDGDGGEFNKVWQWSRSADKVDWTTIATARASLYTVSTDDVGNYLRATVTYRDALGDDQQMAVGETIYKARLKPSANRSPEFPDQDLEMPGVQNTVVVREIAENSAKGTAVGEPVVAFDRDGDEIVHSLSTPEGDTTDNTFDAFTTTILDAGGTAIASADGDHTEFKIDSTTGQIVVEDKDALDFESTTNTDDAFVVTVSATDPSGAAGTITVVIKVTDKNEAPVIGDQTDSDGNAANGIDDAAANTNPTSITTDEEGTGAVQIDVAGTATDVTFLADDPDTTATNDTATVTWSTAGPDGKYFTVAGGALMFDTASPKKPLSFEAMGSADGDNVYEVDIVAASDTAKSTHRLKVTLANVEETGSIMHLSQRRPVTGTPIVALGHSDKDGGVKDRSWTWYRGVAGLDAATSSTLLTRAGGGVGDGADSTLTAGLLDCAPGRVDPATTPAPCQVSEGSASYTPVDNDAGYTLYVVVKYTDGNNDDDAGTANVNEAEEYAIAASEQASVVSPTSNSSPAFNDQDTDTPGVQNESTSRSVDEDVKGADVGSAVLANDGTDPLLYTLGGPDKDKFEVGRTSGQITTAEKLDYESLPEDAKYHMVTVVATDPFGASTSISVTINVNDVDEDAVVTPTTASAESASECTGSKPVKCTYNENGEDPVAQFDVSDPDTEGITWSLAETDDYKDFAINSDGVLTFKKKPDFETKSSYKVTVTTSAGGSHAVEVTIKNLEEDGEVTFDGNPQPQVGGSLRAVLKDGDGGEFNKVWQWSRSADKVDWTTIATARASLYTVSTDDVGNYLRATVTYRDALGDDQQMAVGETIYKARLKPSANRSPEFPDQDLEMPGVQNTVVVREIAENSAKGTAVGEPVVAFDRDGDEIVHSLSTPEGDTTDNTFDAFTTTILDAGGTAIASADGDHTEFKIDSTTGQIVVEDKDALDFESTTNTDDAFVVTVSATDPSGAAGTITVVIKVTDKNEAPVIGDQTDSDGNAANGIDDAAANTNPTSITTDEEGTGAVQIDVAGTATDVTFLADDPDTTATNDTATVTWSTAGPDGKYFTVAGGALMFDTASPKKPLSFEAMGSADGDNVYEVDIVAASDTAKSTHRLKVTLANVEETGSIMHLSQRRPVTGTPIVALGHSDKDGGVKDRSWTWYRGVSTLADTTLVTAGTTGRGADSTLATGLVKCDDATADPTTTPCQVSEGSASYTPVDADATYSLFVVVKYTDGNNDDDAGTANVNEAEEYAVAKSEQASVVSPTSNSSPAFNDQDTDTPGVQNESTSRSVDEDVKGADVGSAVLANDGTDPLLYTLGGPDKDKFEVGRTSGQITTAEKLDYESLPEDAKYHMVTVMATDPFGASTSISVTINVNDVDEGATIVLLTGPAPEDPGDTCGMTDAGSSKAADCRTLLSIMDELVGDGTASLNWDEDTPITEWDGLAAGTDRVRGIYLPNSGLAGTLPAGITALDALERLTLTGNDLTGDIPDLTGLDNLTLLVLGGNAFTGGIPASLGNLDSLLRLWLHRNEGGFEGGIPAELGNLSTLRYLMLHGNGLTGEIPAELGMATNLKALYLYDNNLTGSIPAELGNLMTDADDTIRLLYLHDNMLSGDIPAELGNLTSLTRILLRGNMLTGCVPAAIADAADLDRSGLMACAN